jgi:hypothetical protein
MVFPSFSASATVNRAKFVKISGAYAVAQCIANDLAIGVSQLGTRDTPIPGGSSSAALEGDPVRVFGQNEVAPMNAGASILAGQFVKPDANGDPIPCGVGEAFSGQALEAQSVTGGEIDIFIQRGVVGIPLAAGTVKQSFYRRCTIAEINAGLVLMPAVAGQRYRINDVSMIAIGGAVAAATAVVVTGTQSTSIVNLLSVAVAALTQSALVRAGAANATILANGASFQQCDANTAISIAKTGSNITTATHVDVQIDYTLEA